MKLRRDKLVQHFQRIACQGQITEAVFQKGFATAALSPDHLLLVIAPGLRGVEPLPEEVGLADLDLVIRAFAMIAGEGNEGVDVVVTVEKHRLVLNEGERGTVGLLTAAPKTIGTRIEPKTVEQLREKVKGGTEIPLNRALITGVRNTFVGLKAQEIELVLGPEGGCFRIGNDTSHKAEIPSDLFKADPPYTLLFGKHLVDVLVGVADFSSAVLRVSGPGSLIAVEDGGYKFLLSPRSLSAEEPKAKTKTKQVEEPAVVGEDE